jgi:hypothetical protein
MMMNKIAIKKFMVEEIRNIFHSYLKKLMRKVPSLGLN